MKNTRTFNVYIADNSGERVRTSISMNEVLATMVRISLKTDDEGLKGWVQKTVSRLQQQGLTHGGLSILVTERAYQEIAKPSVVAAYTQHIMDLKVE